MISRTLNDICDQDFMNRLHASEELAMQKRAEDADAQMQAQVNKAKDRVDGIVAQFTTALFASLATITDMVRKYLTRFTTIFVAPTAIVLFMTGHTILGSLSIGLGNYSSPQVCTPLTNKFSAFAIPLSLLDFNHITVPAINIIYDDLPPFTTILGWIIPVVAFLMYFRLARAQQDFELDVGNQDVDNQDVTSEAKHENTLMEAAQPNLKNQDVSPGAERVDPGTERRSISMEARLPMQEALPRARPLHLPLNDVQHLVRRRN